MAIDSGFERAISTARLSRFRNATTSDDQAWNLYRWNIELAAAWIPLIADVEVAPLRNGIHEQLALHFGRSDWWASNRLLLDDITASSLARVVAKRQTKIARGTSTPGKVIAELMFGTWVMLLGNGGKSALGRTINYEANLWRPAIRFAFSTGATVSGRLRRPTKDSVYSRAANVQTLRNRIAHHEPIFDGIRVSGAPAQIPIQTLWQETVELLSWLNVDIAQIHKSENRVPNLLSIRP